MKIKRYLFIALAIGGLSASTSCSDMMDTKSEMVEFVEDNHLSSAQDTLYSVMGIIRQMQTIADRTVLLGDVRADLLSPMPNATTDIKNMAALDFSADNSYNEVSDYYAVVNNCNYFIAHADTALQKLGYKIFEKEYAAVKAYRAWTYLQLAKVYGSVPLVTDPVLTEREAEQAMLLPRMGIVDICNYFISDLQPYVDTELPQYGQIDGLNSTRFFIPVRVLLGEMCLWAGRYQEACQYLSQYLTLRRAPVPTYNNAARWNGSVTDFSSATVNGNSFVTSITDAGSTENLCFIPMETSEFYGVKSRLADVYESNINNDYYYQVTPSQALANLSAGQDYVIEQKNSDTDIDTIRVPKTGLRRSTQRGDLRLDASVSQREVNRSETDHYSSQLQTMSKLPSRFVSIYRVQRVYLLFAEALCRAGYPSSAFCILKYGLRNQNIERYVDPREREAASELLNFSDDIFTEQNTLPIHGRGCGDVSCDTLYVLPVPSQALASRQDTLDYQVSHVEDMIVCEMALETAFEGNRFFDLMRVALRRNDPAYLATPVASRNGSLDQSLFTRLMDANNWYLPLK